MASEFALVTLRKTKVNELARKGDRNAKLLQTAQDRIDIYISATQLGITIASLLLGWIGESAMAGLLVKILLFLPKEIRVISSNSIAIILAFFLITFLQIVIGELVPKSIALQRTEKTARFIILPLAIFAHIFSPFVWFLNKSGNRIIRVFGLHAASDNQTFHSEEEIKMLLSQSGQQGIIPNEEIEIVQKVFQLGDISVKAVMIPRTEVLAFNVSLTIQEIVKKIAHNPHSRFPVYEHSIDTIVGFIHVKDIYQEYIKNGGEQKIAQTRIVREVIIIPEIKKIDRVLQEMRRKRIHMAVVNDEYGRTDGIITLEDIIESLVGEINDEFDQPEKNIIKQASGSYLIKGSTPVIDVQEKIKLPLKGQGYTTMGGLVFGLLGHEPRVNDVVQINTIILKVTKTDGKRIKQLLLSKENQGKKKRLLI